MGVFASGRIVANREFVARLKDNELVFVLAHELLHLALRTHDRAKGSGRLEFNYAHDYIINDILRVELGFASIPAGGLDMQGAREKSAEQIVLAFRKGGSQMQSQTRVWEGRAIAADRIFGGSRLGSGHRPAAGRESEDGELAGDVLGDKLEREWFSDDAEGQADQRPAHRGAGGQGARPRQGPGGAERARCRYRRVASAHVGVARALSHAVANGIAKMVGIGGAGGADLRASFPARAVDRSDLVLPGRKREAWMLNVLLDTSGSMTGEIPRALGAIAEFCEALAVDCIRMVQCDSEIKSDTVLSPDELAAYQVSGFGGSNLSPAMLALADDPRVTRR